MSPDSENSIGAQITKTFTVENVGPEPLSNLTVSLAGSHPAEFSPGALSSTALAAGESATFTVSYLANTFAERTAILLIESDHIDDPGFVMNLSGAIRLPIHAESFETGLGTWANVGEESNKTDWTRDEGGTPSVDTGPLGGAEGSFYLFTEATLNTNKVAELEATFDFTGYSGVVLEFAYHMHGQSMGDLHVDVFDGDWNTGVFSLIGEQQAAQGDSWKVARVDLRAYSGQSDIRIRLRGVIGNQFWSDMAIDSLKLFAIPPTSFLNYSSGTGGTLTGLLSQEVLVGANGSPVQAVADPGFCFSQWSDGSTENPRTDLTVLQDLSIHALFTPQAVLTFADWVFCNQLLGEAADPAAMPYGARTTNLERYAFNIDPSVKQAVFLTPGTGLSGLPHVYLSNEIPPRLSVEYLRRKSTTDISYLVQFTSDLTLGLQGPGWTNNFAVFSVTDIDNDWERVVVRDSRASAEFLLRVARVRVTLASP